MSSTPYADESSKARTSAASLSAPYEHESSKHARAVSLSTPYAKESSNRTSAVSLSLPELEASLQTNAMCLPTPWTYVFPTETSAAPLTGRAGEPLDQTSAITALPILHKHELSNKTSAVSIPPPAYPYATTNHTRTTLPAYEEGPDGTQPFSDDKIERDNQVEKDHQVEKGEKAEKEAQVEKDNFLPHLEGWPLGLTSFSLCLCLLLATIDTTIISTSLITIASDLGHFDKSSWVIVAYLLTYSGFLVIFARLSDIFGRKLVLVISVAIFLTWSIGCGCAQTIEQLIIFRALQGIGGAGIYALAYASMLDIVPPRLISAASGAISMSTACASILGPIVGGVITSNTTWRWVFWINIPCGVLVMITVLLLFPKATESPKFRSSIKKLDWPGILLSLSGSIFLLVPLEEGGIQFSWKSVGVILMFLTSAACFIGFGVWETILTPRQPIWKMLPLFPTRLVAHRVIGAILCTVFFSGFPFVVTIITIPQRFQIVNDNTPSSAGLHVLPLITMTALSAVLAGALTSAFNIGWHLLVFSNACIALGCGLMSTLPTGLRIAPIGYWYQVILGFGFGLTLASGMVVALGEINKRDNAVAMGALTQLRQLGGVIGLAATQAIRNGKYRSQLAGVLTANEMASILLNPSNIETLSQADAELTRSAYGESSNMQMRVIMAFAILAFIASLFAWQKLPLRVQLPEAQGLALEEGVPAGSDLSALSSNTADSTPKEKIGVPVEDEEANDSTFARGSTGSKFTEGMVDPFQDERNNSAFARSSSTGRRYTEGAVDPFQDGINSTALAGSSSTRRRYTEVAVDPFQDRTNSTAFAGPSTGPNFPEGTEVAVQDEPNDSAIAGPTSLWSSFRESAPVQKIRRASNTLAMPQSVHLTGIEMTDSTSGRRESIPVPLTMV